MRSTTERRRKLKWAKTHLKTATDGMGTASSTPPHIVALARAVGCVIELLDDAEPTIASALDQERSIQQQEGGR